MPDVVVKVNMTQSPPFADGDAPAVDDLVWVWDVSTGALRKATISQLPFSGGGGGGGNVTTVPSPFIIQNDDANYSYDAGTNSVTITDARLLNKSVYPVATTQFGGGEFRLDFLTYKPVSDTDEEKGSVVISNFQLDDDEHITITVPGAGNQDTVYNQLIADVALLKLIAAPYLKTALGPNGGKVFWGRPASEIPQGWAEYTDMRGLMPVACDPDDNDFKTVGVVGGHKSIKLIAENIPELTASIDRPKLVPDIDRGTKASEFSVDTIETVEITVGTPDAEMQNVDVMNPYRIVMWIEFIGI